MLHGTLQAMFSNLESLMDSKTVLGEPVTVGTVTLVPVISLSIGLGSGHIEGLGTGGGGGGATVEPRAVVVIQQDKVSIYSLNGQDTLCDLTQMVPEVSGLWEKDLRDIDKKN